MAKARRRDVACATDASEHRECKHEHDVVGALHELATAVSQERYTKERRSLAEHGVVPLPDFDCFRAMEDGLPW